ncbi:entericidin A/B family lipoprotein [Siccibacter turicensis]|uniref:Entericidin, EcnA/B family n=1 Tax=Siccibacter turicensis TaxID=357233 RepID=A0A2P8VN57_9ENTR|nr:entericidin A/B family lipoprotein [Siccibacter turicensis]MDY0969611.1 entericidin A/B family lipoprotein [Siccibacter turicensis]PSN09007.1 entericidin, EcnA/B family [Siccibacter turicensis]
MSRLFAFLLISLLSLTLLSGCNTARGFGQDVQHLGGAIQRAVQ